MDAQLNLKNSRVLIVGVGGLGCPVAQILARAGVGSLCLVDHDVVDESNLQRQSLFCQDDVGRYKALVAKQALQTHNAWVDVFAITHQITADNIDQLLDHKMDLVIDCTDNFMVRDVINQYCVRHRLPLLSSSAIGEVGQLALFEPSCGCYHCVFGDELGDDNNCTNSGVLSSTVHVIGSMASQVALDFLGRGNNPIAHRLLLWHGQSMTLRHLHFQLNPHCHICGYMTS